MLEIHTPSSILGLAILAWASHTVREVVRPHLVSLDYTGL